MQARFLVLKWRSAFFAMLILLALSGCAQTVHGTGPESGFVAGDGSTQLIAQSQRQKAVDLAGTTLDGKSLNIAVWRGSVVVVNLWASWCGPCRAEAVDLEQVHKQFLSKGVHFLGLNTRDGLAAAKAFTSRFITGYPSIQDQDGTLTLAFGNLGPAATPSTIILDRQGRVAARILGPITQGQLRSVVRAVLEDSAS